MANNLRPDVDSALRRNRGMIMTPKSVHTLQSLLREDEAVVDIVTGNYDGSPGIAALTSQRVLFIWKGLTNGRSEDFALRVISSIEHRAKFMTGEIVVYASNQEARLTSVVAQRADEFVRQARDAIGTPSTPAAAAPAPAAAPTPDAPAAPAPDVTQQLLQLKQLHDAGILTPDEYETKRAELVARL